MKNYFISTLVAIALAVPFGIGGLMLTAPVIATDANANRVLHHFQTCSRDVIHRCDGSIQVKVLEPNHPFNTRYTSRWLPRGSNGIDDKAYTRLYHHWNYHRRHGGPGYAPIRGDGKGQTPEDMRQAGIAVEVLKGIFAYENGGEIDEWIKRNPNNNILWYHTRGFRQWGQLFISPTERGYIEAAIEREKRAVAERERLERELRAREEESIATYRANCNRHNGEWNAEGGPVGKGSCRAFIHYDSEGNGVYRVDEYVGYDPNNPYGFVQRLADDIVSGEEEIVQRYQFNETCRREEGTVLSFPEHNVLNCLVPIEESVGFTTHIRSELFSFNPDEDHLGFDNPDIDVSNERPPELQVTVIDPIANSAAIEDIDVHREATVNTRAALVDLQRDYNLVENQLRGLIDANTLSIGAVGETVTNLSRTVTNLSSDVETNTAAITELVEDTSKNTAGIALSLALNLQPLHYNKSFALTGGMGSFEGETGIGLSFTGRMTDSVFGSVGAGFAGSGDSSVLGVQGSVSVQW